jgi:hypothetical protein
LIRRISPLVPSAFKREVCFKSVQAGIEHDDPAIALTVGDIELIGIAVDRNLCRSAELRLNHCCWCGLILPI